MDVTDFKTGYSASAPEVDDTTQELYIDGADANKDPLRPFKFVVTVVEKSTAKEHILFGVTKISGLKWKVGTFKYYDGGGMIPRSVPTRPEYEPLVFTRALFPIDGLWEWCKRVFNLKNGAGSPNFRLAKMHIYQLSYYASVDEAETLAIPKIERAWQVLKSWPSEYDMGELDREADGISLATLTLEHEGCIVDDNLLTTKLEFDIGERQYSINQAPATP